jgi:hypothetical protein
MANPAGNRPRALARDISRERRLKAVQESSYKPQSETQHYNEQDEDRRQDTSATSASAMRVMVIFSVE